MNIVCPFTTRDNPDSFQQMTSRAAQGELVVPDTCILR